MLASASPQRRAILARLGVPFSVRPAGVSEVEAGSPSAVALENARRKAAAARRHDIEEAIIGCDTVVALDGTVHGKPDGPDSARATLRALSGRTHSVLSGISVLLPAEERTAVARTEVTFRELPDALIEWYIATGEWRERAGAYAIQEAGAALVRSLRGEYENVVGLPLATLLDLYPELLPVRPPASGSP